MCGIVGVIGSYFKKEEEVFRDLLIIDSLRGEDSTGVIGINHQSKPSVFKKAVNAIDFLGFKKADSLINASRILIGHNRFATKGKVNETNAHPFQYGDFTGVHNGTLRNQSLLPDSKSFEVDSENIFYSFSKIGVDETIKKLDGAFTLVWFNEKEKTVSFVRNNERPLFYCYTEDQRSIYFASEAWMLAGILNRRGVKHDPIISVKEGHIYTFEEPAVGKPLVGAHIRKVEMYTKPFVPQNYPAKVPSGNVAPFRTNSEKEAQAYYGKTMEFEVGEQKKGVYKEEYVELISPTPIMVGGKLLEFKVFHPPTREALLEAKKKGMRVSAKIPDYVAGIHAGEPYFCIIPSFITYIEATEKEVGGSNTPNFQESRKRSQKFTGYNGTPLAFKDWKKATKNGCAWCSSPADPKDTLTWIAGDEFVCSDCMEFDMVQDFMAIN